MKKYKINKIVIFTFLCLNMFCINTFAGVFETLDGGNPNGESTNNNTPNSGGSTTPSKSGNTVNYKPGSENYPLKNYAYTGYFTQDMANSYNNFLANTKNGSMVYKDDRGTGQKWDYVTGDDERIFMENYLPAIVFSKNTDNKIRENRTTDYYLWSARGPVNWTKQGVQYQTVTFTMPGKYTVTSVPHQIVDTTKWTETSEKAYDLFSDGHTKILKNNFYASPKIIEKTEKNRVDLQRIWNFEITPEEINKPIKIPDFIPLTPGEEEKIDVDVELIE